MWYGNLRIMSRAAIKTVGVEEHFSPIHATAMRFFYLDPGLQDDVGHHANYCRYIVGELRTRGVETLVFAPLWVDPAQRSQLGAIPHFRVYTYAGTDGDPVC